RDVVGAEWIERSYAPMLEQLGKSGNWRGTEDDDPADGPARRLLAESLFPSQPSTRGPLPDGDTVHHAVVASVAEELSAIAATLSRLVGDGVAAAGVVVALPDTPSYRREAQRLLAPSRVPLRWLFGPPEPGAADAVDVLAHRDLAGRDCEVLLVAGADGAPDALPVGGGWSASDPALLPPILLDALESCHGQLYLSSTASADHRYTDSLRRAFGALASW
ncbi:MAG TPA: hypothetical protein VF945_06160, partial [Polyangia bacterium]